MPKKLPPHLPPKTEYIKDPRRWDTIKLVLFSAGFGLLAGVAGASVTLAWIWPGYGGGDTWAVSQTHNAGAKAQLDPSVSQEINDRVFSVYSGASAGGDTFVLSKKDKLGEAIAVSSDGWLAMYSPTGIKNIKNIKILSNDGSLYLADKSVVDRYSGISYLHIAEQSAKNQNTSQFKVAAFAEDYNIGQDLYVFENNNWYRHSLSFPVTHNFSAHLDTAPAYFYTLDKNTTAGSVVIGADGKVVGFTTSAGLVLPSNFISQIIPALLETGKITYYSLGVEGLLSNEEPIIVNNQQVSGFLVTKIVSKNTSFKKGDILTEINGKAIEGEKYLWYNKGQKVHVSLFRNGKTLEVEATAVEL